MHKYYCECGGLLLPDFDAYKVGDKVKFRVQKGKTVIKVKSLSA